MNSNVKLRRATALTGGAFALALALAACGGGNDTPEGAVENFMDGGAEDLFTAIVDGDADKASETAEEHFCADDVASVEEAAAAFEGMSEEEKATAGEEFDMFNDMSYEIGEVNEEGDTATVALSITADGETTDETFDLAKEDDAWKLCGMF
ncbi:DUF4878 domain-containing protein [Glycomyces sp. A-F 0318]|uniref:DUF4878 domain-containing protein n=1 Tax=Glycomyces amatae TaxID=2881355 RepID=UPI001E4EE34D|nr:DUF4878 domain-containing protein [Glycomyces amatae]MCD0446167.1 DUF4878 domain-containing protein [Glycomyces amatae]